MITAISPHGVKVVYNDGHCIHWPTESLRQIRICRGNCGKDNNSQINLIASVPPDWTVCFDRPCEVVHHGKPPEMTLDGAVGILAAGIRGVQTTYTNAHNLAKIKTALRSFDLRTRSWRNQ